MLSLYNLSTGNSIEKGDLGYLIRNTHKISYIEIKESDISFIVTFNERGVPVKEFRGEFASLRVMKEFFNKKRFEGIIRINK